MYGKKEHPAIKADLKKELGIKETRELLNALMALLLALRDDSKDGDLTVIEILSNYPELLGFMYEMKDIRMIKNELGDLDISELRELIGLLIDMVKVIIDIIKNLKKKVFLKL